MFSIRKKKGNRLRRQPISNEDSYARETYRKHRPDYWLLIISLLLLTLGIIVVYSISPGLAAAQKISEHYYIFKQFVAIGLGIGAFAFFSLLPVKAIIRSKNLLLWLSGAMVLVVQIFGEQVNGASRWIHVGAFSFQAAELVKFALIVWLASFLVERLRKDEIDHTNKTLRPIMVAVAVIGVLIVGLESDFGSGGVMVAIIAIMAFSAGLPLKRIATIGGIIAIGTILAIATTPYRRDRLATYLNPTQDCQNSGYQSCQALIAVGSGGLAGLGLGNGVQAYGYLPEAANDSIFAILGEKFGFIGTSIIISLYAVLFARMRRIIQRTQDSFARLFVIGVMAWISTQMVINIGAMIGLLPLKGITLPLVSYGGTSLVFIMAAMGVVFQISRYTSYAPVRNVTLNEEEQSRENSTGGRRQRRPHYATFGSR